MIDSAAELKRGLLVVEGPHEEHGAAEVLVRRCMPNGQDYAWTIDRWKNASRRHRRFISTGEGDGIFKKIVHIMLSATSSGYDAVIILIDRDQDRRRSKSVADAQQSNHMPIPRAIGLAVESFDVWFLSDEKSLSKVLGVNIQTQTNPEAMGDPKSVMKDLIRQHRVDASQREIYLQIAKIIDLERLSHRCPDGFGPWRKYLEKLGSVR